MDGMEAGMEAKMDDMKDNMEDMKNDLKVDMEGLKEGLTNLIQEMIRNGENIVEETHDEKKINVNLDFINLNVGWKTPYSKYRYEEVLWQGSRNMDTTDGEIF